MLEHYPELDAGKTLLMCLIHDIGEIYDGDISAALLSDSSQKYQGEHRAAERVFSLLPDRQKKSFMDLWQEYEDGRTPESRLVKALDKAETIIQHNIGKIPRILTMHSICSTENRILQRMRCLKKYEVRWMRKPGGIFRKRTVHIKNAGS